MMATAGQSRSDFISNYNLSGFTVRLKVALRTFSFGGNAAEPKPRIPFCALNISWNLAFLNLSIGTGFSSSKIKISLTANEVMHCL